MAELKTKKTEHSVEDFLSKITDAGKQADARVIVQFMKDATGAQGKMWGPSIVGFGDKHLVYESGRELDWFVMGFSPRKEALTLHINGAIEKQQTLLARLGTYKTGKGCLYIKKLADVDSDVLKKIIAQGART